MMTSQLPRPALSPPPEYKDGDTNRSSVNFAVIRARLWSIDSQRQGGGFQKVGIDTADTAITAMSSLMQ